MRSSIEKGKPKIIRACTVPQSLSFVTGMLPELIKDYDVALLSSPGEDWSHIEEFADNVDCIKIPMERQIAPIKDLGSLWKLYRTFRRERPTMVHSMTPKAGLLCMMAAWMAKVPVRVHTFTGLVFPTSKGLKRRILMFTDKLTCGCATHVIPEGNGVLNDLKNNKITRKPMRVLGFGNVRGIDLDYFNPDKFEKPEDSDTFTFVFVGRLVDDKGINELVEAFVKLNKEYSKIRLLLVGGKEDDLDPLKPETSDLIDNHPSIEAVGAQEDVRPFYAQADCAVLPSYREGFPNVVIEAGSMGLPQIVTDINGANEIIEHEVNGLIIPPRDADSLYEAMKRIYLDKTLRDKLSFNAREMISSRFEQSFVRKCLLDFYKDIL